jgi:hypothetical protein
MVIKKNGLIKKSFSMVYEGLDLHIISYYKREDVLKGVLPAPSKLEGLGSLNIPGEVSHMKP